MRKEEALIYYLLEKKDLFRWIQGDISSKVYYVYEVLLPPPPAPPLPEPALTPPQVEDDHNNYSFTGAGDREATCGCSKEMEKAEEAPPPDEQLSDGEKTNKELPAPGTTSKEEKQ
ncbi:hypothetical protein FNV43_RR15166 [Rhamnella rubrinervis]|uniref:Uncharacterized protein n=1 Tax=Rhamnella rubrinervis TaxID=2594499 RepID=A0A8K0GX89_9ROSA|nr:hypothetical protein FNV43_RR15166 [Rhamnella rubrinervis]